ncbi:MAG: 4-hydroxybenzoate octaprenyltransferase [Gammaproteobacteria bacterium]|nr:4-hydroxybenzoate octaprenyltransferase [Gammaproteobacteria bacterium]
MRVFSAWPDLKPILKRWYLRARHSVFIKKTLPQLAGRADAWFRLMRLNRPIGTFLLLWPTWWALWLASEGHPKPEVFVVFTLGVIVMRAAGCVINDYADRNWDGDVKRTADRPLATGEIKPAHALVLFAVLIAIAFALVLTMNRLTIYLSIGGVILAILYPFSKRYTHLPQPVLGAAFGWAVPMVYAAQTGTVTNTAGLLFIATVIWATAYDTMYAMVDRDDDLKVGIKSTAILFGDQDKLIIFILQLVLLFDLVLVGRQLSLGDAYYWGVAFAACTVVYQQWLIRDRKREACFKAFLNNNWFGIFVFAGIVLDFAFRQQVVAAL